MKSNNRYILIVDDSQTNNTLLEAVLGEHKYATKITTSAVDAWDLIHHEKPELILLDLLMPKISGFRLLELLKTKSEFKDIPVFVISAICQPETISTLKEMGATDFFCKPVKFIPLMSRIKEICPISET